jgi:alkanesulfonate monooxygenase SsuD/methylene tetrahydromethanopterin reductase-like flavin-dependent oxidoreductase (luciferase family)
VVIQAGQSGRGKSFSARWGEVVFVSTHTSMEHGRQLYREMKDDVASQGRDPEQFFITPSAYVVCAETKAEAEDKMALVETLATDEDALSLLSEAMNFDFASRGIDEPFTDEELATSRHTQSMRDGEPARERIANPTPRDPSNSAIARDQTSRSSADRRGRGTVWSGGSPNRSLTGSCWRRPTCLALHGLREIRRCRSSTGRGCIIGLRWQDAARNLGLQFRATWRSVQ